MEKDNLKERNTQLLDDLEVSNNKVKKCVYSR